MNVEGVFYSETMHCCKCHATDEVLVEVIAPASARLDIRAWAKSLCCLPCLSALLAKRRKAKPVLEAQFVAICEILDNLISKTLDINTFPDGGHVKKQVEDILQIVDLEYKEE